MGQKCYEIFGQVEDSIIKLFKDILNNYIDEQIDFFLMAMPILWYNFKYFNENKAYRTVAENVILILWFYGLNFGKVSHDQILISN